MLTTITPSKQLKAVIAGAKYERVDVLYISSSEIQIVMQAELWDQLVRKDSYSIHVTLYQMFQLYNASGSSVVALFPYNLVVVMDKKFASIFLPTPDSVTQGISEAMELLSADTSAI